LQYLKNNTLSKKTRSNLYYFIGEIYRDNLKDFDKALAHFIKIKYIYPGTPLMNNINQKIVECLENSGRSRAAQLALKESTSLNRNNTKESSVILAKIDNEMITLADFNDWYSLLPDDLKSQFTTRDKKRELLKQFVSQELMYKMAMRKGLQNDPEVIKKTFDTKKSFMTQKLMQSELMSQIKISQKDIEMYYKANQSKYKKPLQQVFQLVQQDLWQEKMQEKSAELINRMTKANSVQIFEDNMK
jgi:tetratricopeptide (TPR) repeat protein